MPRLKIENFKCYRKTQLSFGNLTILVGANGTGKSTIVQSMLLLREGVFSALGRYLPLNGFMGQNLGSAEDVVKDNDPSLKIKIAWSVDEPYRTSSINLSVPQAESMLSVEVDYRRIGRNEFTRPDFHFLAADRMGATISQPMKAYDYPYTGEKGQYCAQLLANRFGIKVMDTRRYGENSSPYLIDQVNLYLNEIISGVDVDARASEEMQTAQVLIRNSAHKRLSLATNIGFGISYLLPIIVTGLIAREGSIMIVENPEAHLHPEAQSRVGRFLAMVADTGTRVVVETHSDHLINGMQYYAATHPKFIPEVIIQNCSITNGGEMSTVQINLDENADYTTWPDGFMDQSRKDLYALYKARGT